MLQLYMVQADCDDQRAASNETSMTSTNSINSTEIDCIGCMKDRVYTGGDDRRPFSYARIWLSIKSILCIAFMHSIIDF